MTVDTPVIRTVLSVLPQHIDFVPLPDGLRVQVIPTMADLPKARIHHFAAFIKSSRLLVVWDDDPRELLNRAANLEKNFVEMVNTLPKPNIDDNLDLKKAYYEERASKHGF